MHLKRGHSAKIIRPFDLIDRSQRYLIDAQWEGLAHLDHANILNLPRQHGRHRKDRDPEPGMGHRLAPIGARQAGKALNSPRNRAAPGARPQINRRPKDHPDAQNNANRPHGRAPSLHRPDQRAHGQRQNHRRNQRPRHPAHIAALPRHHRAKRHDDRQAHDKGRKSGVEKRLAHAQLGAPAEFGNQGPDRADEHHKTRHCQQQVVQDQRAFTADHGEHTLGLKRAGAQRKQHQSAPGEHPKDHQDEHAARRIIGEGMHRGDHAGAHDKSAYQAEPKGEDGE